MEDQKRIWIEKALRTLCVAEKSDVWNDAVKTLSPHQSIIDEETAAQVVSRWFQAQFNVHQRKGVSLRRLLRLPRLPRWLTLGNAILAVGIVMLLVVTTIALFPRRGTNQGAIATPSPAPIQAKEEGKHPGDEAVRAALGWEIFYASAATYRVKYDQWPNPRAFKNAPEEISKTSVPVGNLLGIWKNVSTSYEQAHEASEVLVEIFPTLTDPNFITISPVRYVEMISNTFGIGTTVATPLATPKVETSKPQEEPKPPVVTIVPPVISRATPTAAPAPTDTAIPQKPTVNPTAQPALPTQTMVHIPPKPTPTASPIIPSELVLNEGQVAGMLDRLGTQAAIVRSIGVNPLGQPMVQLETEDGAKIDFAPLANSSFRVGYVCEPNNGRLVCKDPLSFIDGFTVNENGLAGLLRWWDTLVEKEETTPVGQTFYHLSINGRLVCFYAEGVTTLKVGMRGRLNKATGVIEWSGG